MKTEDLIVSLASSAREVRPLAAPGVRFVRWAGGAFLFLASGVLVVGLRKDAGDVIAQPAFLAAAATTAATACLAALGALILSVPGADRPSLTRQFPLVLAALWFATLTALLVGGGAPLARIINFPFHMLCAAEIVGFALVPGWVLFSMIRQAAPLRPGWTATLAALAAAALGAVATQFLCPIDDAAHQLVGHFTPAAATTLIGAALGRRFLDRLFKMFVVQSEFPR